MGTLGLTSSVVAAFRSDAFATGLDFNRFKGEFIPGMWRANAAATIRQGQLVAMNSSNEIILSTGANVIGVARFHKMTLGKAVNADEQIILTGTTAINLKRANVSNVAVRSAAGQGGTTYTVTTDYTVNTTNGTVTRVALGAITDGQTVFVTYTFDLTEADYNLLGKNFWQSNDWSTIQDSRFSVIMGPALIFTTEYDTSKTYGLTGASSTLYSTTAGLFTSTSGQEHVGKVISVPSASDPYLGVRLNSSAIII